jgi:hypothetical protein
MNPLRPKDRQHPASEQSDLSWLELQKMTLGPPIPILNPECRRKPAAMKRQENILSALKAGAPLVREVPEIGTAHFINKRGRFLHGSRHFDLNVWVGQIRPNPPIGFSIRDNLDMAEGPLRE